MPRTGIRTTAKESSIQNGLILKERIRVEFSIGNLETRTTRRGAQKYESVPVTTKKRMIYKYSLKYKEKDRRTEQVLNDKFLHINEDTVHKISFCTKITELKTLGKFIQIEMQI